MKWLRWTLIGALSVLTVVGLAVAWMVNTASGTRAAVRLAQSALGGKLQVAGVEGTLAGPLTLRDLRFADPAGGTRFSAQWIRADLQLLELLRLTVHVKEADIRGVVVDMRPSNEPEPPSAEPFTLEPPLDILIDRFTARDARVLDVGEPVVQIDHAIAVGRWTDAGIAMKQLDVRSPQGEVHFVANVRGDRIYVGDGRGSFRWRAGEREYRGTLSAEARDENARLALHLSRPLRANLQAALKQSPALPWSFSLQIPNFDPRAELLPGSQIQSLGATLAGAGSLKEGRVTGQLLVDGETLHVRPLHFVRNERQLDIDATLRINAAPGALRAVGHIRTDRQPASIDAHIDWNDLVLPERWAGQVLHSRGNVRFEGNAQRFATQGRVALGPPQQLADIALRIDGTASAITLHQFDIVQPQGRLAATGTIDLQPHVAWDVQAHAQRFDPGAFLAAWRGQLNFALASNGELAQSGPSAKLTLTDLDGRLRGRALSGRADLQLQPNKVLAGVLDLRSGQSEVHVEGKPGSAMDALVTLNVASLNDWVPDTSGRIDARYRITGRWPELRIAGTTDADDVFFSGTRIGSVAVNLDITNPLRPDGSARLEAHEINAAGFAFQRVLAEASGNFESHRVSFSSVGTPLDADFAVQGSLREGTWSASLNTLMLDVERAAHLTLAEPSRITYAPESTTVTQTCLRDGQIQLCVAGEARQSGELQAQYSLRDVPLALANALAPSLPVALEGTLQGNGDVRRDADGTLHGHASISSTGGQLAQRLDEAGAEKQVLLRYADLRIAATLAGAQAQTSVQTRLDDRGQLEGALSVSGLSEAVSPIQGRLTVSLPTLAPIALFVPQLANLSGSVDSQLTIAGTVQEPRLAGHVRANDIAADVPMLGLELRNGQLEALPREDGSVRIAGGIRSGDGEVRFTGTASRTGTVDLQLRGKDFLAADIPSAKVIVAPALDFVRQPDGMKLTGEVGIPQAKVNLEKLPRGGKKVQQASPDVVVIDERTTEQETASAPLQANITVNLGNKVELTGYGLEARVDGRLDVREVPGAPTSGSGEIRIQGRYKAYGQDLTIQQGQLLYAGTPLDNPRLNIVAVREIEDADVTAGLRITGSAQAPQLSVFSEPAMGEANALAYLVTGRPLDQVGTGEEGDSDMLQTAAESLGSAAGGLLAKKIGSRLGVDEVSVKESESLGGSAAFTVGQYLSPRLFLSYGVGLFEPGEVITLRYKLSKNLALQAERGPEDTRAGLRYRIEK